MIIRFLLFLTLLSTALTAMSQDNRLKIVASHSILGDVVNNVVGDVADVSLLMPAGTDPHSFEPTPSDLISIAQADLVFINGAFFEEGLLESIENAGEDVPLIEVSACVTIIEFGASDSDHNHDHTDEANNQADDEIGSLCNQYDLDVANFSIYSEQLHQNEAVQLGKLYSINCGEHHADEDHADEDHHHEEGGCDPHVWMNPVNVMYWVLLIRDTLIEFDPANADVYNANADAYLGELGALVDDFVIPLVESLPEDQRILIASHDSLGYLRANFGFKIVGTIIPSGTTIAEPSTQDIARVIDLVQSESVPAIFSETIVNDNIAQAIADETGAQLVVLYSDTLSDENGSASNYIDFIRSNFTVIIEALSGGS